MSIADTMSAIDITIRRNGNGFSIEGTDAKLVTNKGSTYHDAKVIQQAASQLVLLVGDLKQDLIEKDEFVALFNNLFRLVKDYTVRVEPIGTTQSYVTTYGPYSLMSLVNRTDMGGRYALDILVPMFNWFSKMIRFPNINQNPFMFKKVDLYVVEKRMTDFLKPYSLHINGNQALIHSMNPSYIASCGGTFHEFSDEVRNKHHIAKDIAGIILIPAYINYIINTVADKALGEPANIVPYINSDNTLIAVDGEFITYESISRFEPIYKKGCVLYGIPVNCNMRRIGSRTK